MNGATRDDAFLGSRLVLRQPARGYRAGADAVMLAAACPAQPGQSVLELGCGAGVALLCLGRRVGGLDLTGIELQADYAALAWRNAEENNLPATIHQEDLGALPDALRARQFDHVIANPPYFTAGTTAPDAGRGTARHEATGLDLWLDVALRRLRPSGVLTIIQHIERLPEILALIHGRAGAICALPVAARSGRAAGRVIVTAKKGARAPFALLAPFIMHKNPQHLQDSEDLTDEAQAVLRHAAGLDLQAR